MTNLLSAYCLDQMEFLPACVATLFTLAQVPYLPMPPLELPPCTTSTEATTLLLPCLAGPMQPLLPAFQRLSPAPGRSSRAPGPCSRPIRKRFLTWARTTAGPHQ